VVVASVDVSDAHVVVVDHDGKHIGRVSVRAQQHKVIEVLGESAYYTHGCTRWLHGGGTRWWSGFPLGGAGPLNSFLREHGMATWGVMTDPDTFKYLVTAQAVWKEAGFFPWENGSYVGGIDNVKILTTLRIFSYKAHVYAGLAILNPYARQQVKRYAVSESELFKLMIQEERQLFRERLYRARDFVFHESRKPIMLNDKVMKEFSLSGHHELQKPNSHLSILSMVDAWYHLGVNPYDNLICQTPPFRLRLGIAEYLFKNEELLEESIETALFDKTIRGDDLEFHSAVREWSAIIGYGDMEGYKKHFNDVQAFFKDRLEDGKKQSAELIRRLMTE